MRTTFLLVALATAAHAAPVSYNAETKPVTREDQPLGAPNVDLSNTIVGDIVDKVPVDMSVEAPVLPESRAVEVDLGGGGLSVRRRAVEVDLGGGGLSVRGHEQQGGPDIDLSNTVVGEIVGKLPVDVSVEAPVLPEPRAVEVDLGGGGLSVRRRAVEVDLGGGGLSV